MEKRENLDVIPKNEVLAAALKTKETMVKMSHQSIDYGCHTQGPYSDGYGDAGYGDYEDAV
jgi:hypothetical protein